MQRKQVTGVRNSVVVHVRVRSRPELDFGWPRPARGEGRGSGKRRGSGQGERQRLPVVFEGAELPVQLLELSVLLGLERHHLLDVPIEEEIPRTGG